MSPLTSSLFAFAALLAVATALKNPDPYCGELNQGYRTDMNETYGMEREHGGEHTIPDKCTNFGRKLVGQSVVVCNEPNSKPVITPVDEYEPDRFDKVNVDCPSNTYGCERLTIFVTQYCEMVVPPDDK